MSDSAAGRQQDLPAPPVLLRRQPRDNCADQPKQQAKADKTASSNKSNKREGAAGSREDIGPPTNFCHVQHVGYDNLDVDGGEIQLVEIADDPVLRFLFGQIGEDFEKAKHSKKGARKVEKFIAGLGGMDRVRQAATEVGYAPANSSNQSGEIKREEIADDPVLKFLFGQIGLDFEKIMSSKKGVSKLKKFIADMGGMDPIRQAATEIGYGPAPRNQRPLSNRIVSTLSDTFSGAFTARHSATSVTGGAQDVQPVGCENLDADNREINRVGVADYPVLKFLFSQIEKAMQTKAFADSVEKFVAGMGGMDRVYRMAAEAGYAPVPRCRRRHRTGDAAD